MKYRIHYEPYGIGPRFGDSESKGVWKFTVYTISDTGNALKAWTRFGYLSCEDAKSAFNKWLEQEKKLQEFLREHPDGVTEEVEI